MAKRKASYMPIVKINARSTTKVTTSTRTSSSRTRSRTSICIVLAGALIGMIWHLLVAIPSKTRTSSTSPYYEASWCTPLQPLALMYMGMARLSLSLMGGSEVMEVSVPRLTTEEQQQQQQPPQKQKQKQKLAIVTGSNTGIGYETARALVQRGWKVVLACRSLDKATVAKDRINAESFTLGGQAIVSETPLDLSDLESIDSFVQDFRQQHLGGEDTRLDVLINNAGRNTSGRSPAGMDILFQSNFLGHFRLTEQLLPYLQHGTGRIVQLSSAMHHFPGRHELDETYWKRMAVYEDKDDEEDARPPETYAASKLAAILIAHEWNQRYEGKLTSVAVNPGAAASDIWRGFPGWVQQIMQWIFLTPQQASVPVVAAALLDLTQLEVHSSEPLQEDNYHPNKYFYVQPYWQPLPYDQPPFALTELLGPYIGYVPTVPRLPLTSSERKDAGRALWTISKLLTTRPDKS